MTLLTSSVNATCQKSRVLWTLFALAAIACSGVIDIKVDAFTHVVPRTSTHNRVATSLYFGATVEPPPAGENEKEKKKRNSTNNNNGGNYEDWTETKGGFIPNIIRRNKNSITQVIDIQGYKDVVVDEPDRMVVVRFYAPWCRSCKAVEPKFRQLANRYSPEVKFVEVPLTKENAYLHEGLGVPSVPFGHIYHPDVGLVEEMKMNKRDFKEFKKVFENYIDGHCILPEEIEDANSSEWS